MTFQTPHGPTVIATAIQAGPSFNGWRYTSEPLSVDITFPVCSDGMTARRYHDTVMVLVGEQEYRGRSEEHQSEPQSLTRISYAGLCSTKQCAYRMQYYPTNTKHKNNKQ